MKKLQFIDALRGLAILAVILIHTSQFGTPITSFTLSKIVQEGSKGVQLFYIASALTLFLSFQHRTQNEQNPTTNFFIRRIFRIAPMYYLGITYYIFQDGLGKRYWLADQDHISLSNILANLSFTHGTYPYWINSLVPGGWSIAIEMTFYTITPILFKFIKNINHAITLFISAISFHAITHPILLQNPLISSNNLWNEYLNLYFPSQLPIFALGIILFFLIFHKNTTHTLNPTLLLILTLLIFTQLTSLSSVIFTKHTLFSIAFCLFAYALAQKNYTIFINPITTYIGKLSYSLYLLHFAVLHWLNQYQLIDYTSNSVLNFFLRFIITTTLSTILATITFNTIEKPFQQLGNKIISYLQHQHQ